MSTIKLAHQVSGQGSPQRVLVHGLFDSHRSWAGGFTVVTLDLHGHGASPVPESGYAPLEARLHP